MTTFEYLAVLISIIVGLGITHLLGGVARFIHHPDRYKFYWVHLLWICYAFALTCPQRWCQLLSHTFPLAAAPLGSSWVSPKDTSKR